MEQTHEHQVQHPRLQCGHHQLYHPCKLSLPGSRASPRASPAETCAYCRRSALAYETMANHHLRCCQSHRRSASRPWAAQEPQARLSHHPLIRAHSAWRHRAAPWGKTDPSAGPPMPPMLGRDELQERDSLALVAVGEVSLAWHWHQRCTPLHRCVSAEFARQSQRPRQVLDLTVVGDRSIFCENADVTAARLAM